MKKKWLQNRSIALLTALCLCFNLFVPFGLTSVEATETSTATYSASQMKAKAVDFINGKFKNGEFIDGYTASVLSQSGEDLASDKWTINGKTLKSQIQQQSDLLGDDSSLITYITKTQNADGSFGPYANIYGSRAPLQALARIKADTVGTSVYSSVENSIAQAVGYLQQDFVNGTMSYEAGGFGLDYRAVQALKDAGQDLTVGTWVYAGKSLQDEVVSSAVYAKNNSSLNVVELAKNLTALHAVAPGDSLNGTLAQAIRDKALVTDSQLYFGGSVYDDVVVLTALGEAGQLGGIDQNKALAYLNTFQHVHTNSFGLSTGMAWGGWDPEEPDLSGQILTALSYFNQTPEVSTAIGEGIKYLQDIQDTDTAAVKAQWDSTVSTAEVLIALKSLNKSFLGADSAWVKKSKTKTLAQYLLALNQLGDTTRAERLANLLIGRQKTEGPGVGSFENSVYSDMWAFIALGEAGKIGTLNVDNAKAYIESKQTVAQAAYGSWGETFEQYYPDVLSSIQAIRALNYLTEGAPDDTAQNSVSIGLGYLHTLQQTDGSISGTFDDPVNDTAQLTVALLQQGLDPEGPDWTQDAQRVNPVSYLMKEALNDDGSFGSTKNILGAADALYAYTLLQDTDLVEKVSHGVGYLQGQYVNDAANRMYKDYGGFRASTVLDLAGEDLTSDKWSVDGQSLDARIKADANGFNEQTSVVDLSKGLIALSGLKVENNLEQSRLVNLLASKQQTDGNFADGAIYNEIDAYLALTMANGWGSLSQEQQAKAKAWLINAQTKSGSDQGTWQYEYNSAKYTDTLSTAQAIYVLAHFADANQAGSATYQAIQDGLAWLKAKQDASGKINISGEDAAVDTAETVRAVLAVGQNPNGPAWSNGGNTLIDYLRQSNLQNPNGSFGPYANVSSTVSVLLALLEYNQTYGWVNFSNLADDEASIPTDPGTITPVPTGVISVEIAVVGQDGKCIYGPRSVSVAQDSEWGQTVLGALDATRLDYIERGGLVEGIEGQNNVGLNGWMYKINDSIPSSASSDEPISAGDHIIWWYSNTYNSTGPNWDDLEAGVPYVQIPAEGSTIQLSEDVQRTLDNLTNLLGPEKDGGVLGALGEVEKTVAVVGVDKPVNRLKLAEKRKQLKDNVVDVSQKVSHDQDSTLTDALGEIGLTVPAEALTSDKELTIQEITPTAKDQVSSLKDTEAKGYQLASSIYQFGPDGTTFEEPVTVAIKFALPPFVRPENVSLSWYDEEHNSWQIVPAVMDVDSGQLVAKLKHFSQYAIFTKTSSKSFDDVTESSYNWARQKINTLAGTGIINGVDEVHFQPGRSITRAELVTMLVKALGLSSDEATKSEFKDVQANAWYAESVKIAAQAGLVHGYGSGDFRPNRNITREEIAVILANALQLSTSKHELTFTDSSKISTWAKSGVAAVAQAGYVTGYPQGDFKPGQQASRAECAVMMYNVLEQQ